MSGVINSQKKFVVRGVNSRNVQHRQSVTVRRSGSVETLHRHGRALSGNRQSVDYQQARFSQLESQYIRNLQQQIYFLELENSHLKNQLKKGVNIQPKLIADSEMLMEKLRETASANQKASEALKDRDIEVDTVLQERAVIAERLKNAHEAQSREKEILCQEIVDLRKRVDDCEPDLARKEAQFAKVQTELVEVSNRARALQNMCDSLKEQLDHKSRESTVSKSLEVEREAEAEKHAECVRILEQQIVDQRAKIRAFTEESGVLRQKSRELELKARKEKGIAEKLSEENTALITETSQLTAKLARLEAETLADDLVADVSQKYEHIFSDLSDSRIKQNQLKQELFRVQEQLRAEQVKNKNINSQMMQEESGFAQVRESNTHLQREVESLESQNRSLSSENQQFRKEKLTTELKLEELRKGLSNKDLELVALRDRLQTAEEQYRLLLEQYQQESVIQDQRFQEFEDLAQKVKDLSHNIRSNNFLPSSFSPATSNPE